MTLKEGSERRHKGFKVCVCVSLLPDLNLIKHVLEILEQRFLPPSTKHQMIEFIVEEWYQIEFQTLRLHGRIYAKAIEAVLAAHGGPTPY